MITQKDKLKRLTQKKSGGYGKHLIVNPRLSSVRTVLEKHTFLKDENRCLLLEHIENNLNGKVVLNNTQGINAELFKASFDNIDLAIKVNFFLKNKSVQKNPAEVKIFQLVREMHEKNISPHFVLYVTDFECDTSDIYDETAQVEYSDKVHVIVTEWINSGNLKEYLEKHKNNPNLPYLIKSIVFQMTYSLACLQKRWPAFRHNDLHPGNILIYSLPTNRGPYTSYKYYDKIFRVPNYGVYCVITDFGLSEISTKVDNKMTERLTAYGIKPELNKYYDIHYLVNSIIITLKIDTTKKEYEWMNLIVPRDLQGYKKETVKEGRLINKIHHTTPNSILSNTPVFSNYTQYVPPPLIENYYQYTGPV
jgi:serine/threonine protein kinase